MQFNSFEFILLFFPVTIVAYFLSNKRNTLFGKWVLLIASMLFCVYTGWKNLLILGISLAINYVFVIAARKRGTHQRIYLVMPIIINVGLLLYFKYLNFAITNINVIFGSDITMRELALPVGISFFTFQQIAYLVSSYRGEIEGGLLDYLVYILYFPKLLMGPLMEPVDFISQINDPSRKVINWDNIASGIQIFSLGLFKKVMIADIFANAVSWGFEHCDVATAMDWLLVMLCYTFEIYYDFSGYSDMAVGASLMLNIELPINFDSPYKAISIRDFWKRWHISLTRFFTKYIYIELGGSRKGILFTCINTMMVFVISGIWHGANWTFILWGVLHGAFSILDRLFDRYQSKICDPARWIGTFTIVNVLWLLFRADSIGQWITILDQIIGLQILNPSDGLIDIFKIPESTFLSDVLRLHGAVQHTLGFWMVIYIVLSLAFCMIPNNNYKRWRSHSLPMMFVCAIAFVWGFICLSEESVFVYFNF